MTRNKKRAIIIVIWLVLLLLANTIFFNVASGIYHDKAREELLELSATVAGQIPVLTENDYYTHVDSDRMEYSKLKALSLALQDTENIYQQKGFLDEFVQTAGFDGLIVFNRDAAVVFSCGDVSDISTDPEAIRTALEERPFEQFDRNFTISEDDRDSYLSSRRLAEENNEVFMWSAGNYQWLIVAQREKSDTEKQLLDYFSWKNVLSGITIGRSGSVLAVSDEDGIILSCSDHDLEGRPVEEMKIRLEGSSSDATLSTLMEAFPEAGRIQSVSLGGKKYYASRVKERHTLMLALYPEDDIMDSIGSAASLIVHLLALFTGISVVYAFFHLRNTDENQSRSHGHYTWNSALAGRLRVIAVITCACLLAASVYLQALSAYAESFRYTAGKVDSVVDRLGKNDEKADLLEKWFENENLVKCRVLRCILDHTPADKLSRGYLASLSTGLGVRNIYIYDENGNLTLTDSPFIRNTLDPSDPFYALLTDRSELVGTPERDMDSGEFRQKVGLSLLNDDQECIGLIVIDTDPAVYDEIKGNLDYRSVCDQLSLKDETSVIVLGSEDLIVRYLSEFRGGRRSAGLDSYNYTGCPASDMGISADSLRDHYNGSMTVLDSRYFVSVRRYKDYFLLIMRPWMQISSEHLWMMAAALINSAALAAVLILFSCLDRKPAEAGKTPGGAGANAGVKKIRDRLRIRNQSVNESIGSLMKKKKPYFEQRWPEDSIPWKDKTPSQKFSVVLKYILILTMMDIILHVRTSNDNTIWYYCFQGQWESGVNLYSITACLINALELFVIRLILHKFLYLIAKAVGPKGETICHLLDSCSVYILLIVGVFLCLSHFGVNAQELSLTGGVAGVIFGIGCQSIVSDIFAGILMVFEGVVHVGDFVTYSGQHGIVLSIGVRTTRLKWYNDETFIRNNEFRNYIISHQQASCELCLGADESVDRVEDILKKELPAVHDNLSKLAGEMIEGPIYDGARHIEKEGTVLSFSVFCRATLSDWMPRALDRELKQMCERNQIIIKIPENTQGGELNASPAQPYAPRAEVPPAADPPHDDEGTHRVQEIRGELQPDQAVQSPDPVHQDHDRNEQHDIPDQDKQK